MAILRTIKCSICGKTETEENYGSGWKNWGQLHGIILDGDVNPALCPEHLISVADFVDRLKEKTNGMD